MPRIRKKTSNRTKTHERKRLQQKIRDGKKKKAKLAKKNPQWKSKHKKDPGIPNNFPFKDQVLAEVAEQRRIAAEEKQRRKDEKKAKRAADKDEDKEDDNFDGVGSIAAKQLLTSVKSQITSSKMQVDDDDEDEEEPLLINRELPTLQSVLDRADAVLHVLDARDPLSFRSAHLEEWANTKSGCRTLFVLNKIDLCPRESVSQWLSQLQKEHPTFLFRSASELLPGQGKGKGKATLDDSWGADAILAQLGDWAKEKGPSEQPFAVAVVGVTNVGKSSLINSLAQKQMVPIYSASSPSRGATTTEYPYEASINDIRFIDTPGLAWSHEDSQNRRARDILLRNRGRIDKLKDPIPPVEDIVKRSSAEDLMLLYSLPAFTKGDTSSFLAGVARASQLVKKHGDLDLTGAARVVLRDWNTSKLVWYCIPSGSGSTSQLDDPLLQKLCTRKELRKSGGVVKMTPGDIDTRKVLVEDDWIKDSHSSESEDEDEEEYPESDDLGSDNEDDEEDDEESQDDDDEEEEEASSPPAPPSSAKHKRKAKAAPESAPSAKKVAFAPPPKGTKQFRAQESKRVANLGSKSKKQQTEETYDFRKYF